jgi:hypothetical protein
MVVSMWRFLAVAVLAGAAVTAQAEGTRVRLGGVSVSGGYYSGPGWYGPGYWSPAWWGPAMWRPWGPMWADPLWYGAWAHPGYWNGFLQGPGMGEVKLSKPSEEAMVYLDGAYAGPAKKLKSMWLEPGVYSLEVRDDGRTWQRKIYVLSGKTLALRPELKGETR